MAVIGPAAKFHEAALLVEREPFDVHLAAGLVDGRRIPVDHARVMNRCLGQQGDLVVTIGAVWKRLKRLICYDLSLAINSLVVQDNVRQPNVLSRNV